MLQLTIVVAESTWCRKICKAHALQRYIEICKHEIELLRQTNVKKTGKFVRWPNTISINDERQEIGKEGRSAGNSACKSAGRIVGLPSNISAPFRFTRQRIHCIGQAGLLAWRVNRSASKPGPVFSCTIHAASNK